MKLRIRGNALRLRLSQAEVGQFAEHGLVEDCIRFNGRELRYVLSSSPAERVHIEFDGHTIMVIAPTQLRRTWAESDEVGFEEHINLTDGDTLTVLVEKDFQCLTERPGEDESDNFPNPDASTGHSR